MATRNHAGRNAATDDRGLAAVTRHVINAGRYLVLGTADRHHAPAVYFSGAAGVVTGSGLEKIIEIYSRRSQEQGPAGGYPLTCERQRSRPHRAVAAEQFALPAGAEARIPVHAESLAGNRRSRHAGLPWATAPPPARARERRTEAQAAARLARRRVPVRPGKDDQMTTSMPSVEAALAVFAAVEQRDDVAFAWACQPDVEFCWRPSLPYGRTVRGLAGRGEGWADYWYWLQPQSRTRKRRDSLHSIARIGDGSP